ncbi:MAG: hypothetical protein MUF45_03820 [Spirosomaceae bacterium]|nr:hypothetical protein [Spirosomataceae bacterium]
MKKLKSIAALFFVSFKIFAQTPDDVFNKYYEATGGKELWDEIKTYTIKQSYKANAATDFDQEISVSLDEQAISKVKTLMKKDFIYVAKGQEGWLKIPMGSRDKATKFDIKDLSERERNSLILELRESVIPFWDYAKRGYRVRIIGSEGKNIQVELANTNQKYDLFFNTDTGLLTKQVLTEGREITTIEHQKYTKSSLGISYASESTSVNNIDRRNNRVTTSILFNDKLDSALFVK